MPRKTKTFVPEKKSLQLFQSDVSRNGALLTCRVLQHFLTW